MRRNTKKLKAPEIDKKLKKLSEWQCDKKQTSLVRVYNFPDFVSSLAFVARVAVHAEILGHHPKIEIDYGVVTVTLTTHDVSGLSSLDFELAKRIDNLG